MESNGYRETKRVVHYNKTYAINIGAKIYKYFTVNARKLTVIIYCFKAAVLYYQNQEYYAKRCRENVAKLQKYAAPCTDLFLKTSFLLQHLTTRVMPLDIKQYRVIDEVKPAYVLHII